MYPNTTEQEESRGVPKQVTVIVSLVGKHRGKSTEAEICDVEEPSKSRSGIGGIGVVGRSCSLAKLLSTKQCVDPESINVRKSSEDCTRGEESRRVRESGSERADALSLTRVALEGSTQPSASAESGGLLLIFLSSADPLAMGTIYLLHCRPTHWQWGQ